MENNYSVTGNANQLDLPKAVGSIQDNKLQARINIDAAKQYISDAVSLDALNPEDYDTGTIMSLKNTGDLVYCKLVAPGYYWDKTTPGTGYPEYESMPRPSSTWSGRTVKYIGSTNALYTSGATYTCTNHAESHKVWVSSGGTIIGDNNTGIKTYYDPNLNTTYISSTLGYLAKYTTSMSNTGAITLTKMDTGVPNDLDINALPNGDYLVMVELEFAPKTENALITEYQCTLTSTAGTYSGSRAFSVNESRTAVHTRFVYSDIISAQSATSIGLSVSKTNNSDTFNLMLVSGTVSIHTLGMRITEMGQAAAKTVLTDGVTITGDGAENELSGHLVRVRDSVDTFNVDDIGGIESPEALSNKILYIDKSTNWPYYFNGTTFKPLLETPRADGTYMWINGEWRQFMPASKTLLENYPVSSPDEYIRVASGINGFLYGKITISASAGITGVKIFNYDTKTMQIVENVSTMTVTTAIASGDYEIWASGEGTIFATAVK